MVVKAEQPAGYHEEEPICSRKVIKYKRYDNGEGEGDVNNNKVVYGSRTLYFIVR